MFNYEKIEINRSETTVTTVEVPPWEVPVLVQVNGDDRCKPVGILPVDRELPEPEGEFHRLATKYGTDENGQDHVATIYGVGVRGVQKLAEEIAKAAVEPTASDDPMDGLFDVDVDAEQPVAL